MPIDDALEKIQITETANVKEKEIKKVRDVKRSEDKLPYEIRFKSSRSDVRKIINLNDVEFNKWYEERKEATERLLRDYKLFGSIPNLSYGRIEHTYDMTANTTVNAIVNSLIQGLEYLELIRKMREYGGGEI